MSDGEVQHQLWTHKQLGDQRKSVISQWPLIHEDVFAGLRTSFAHYGLTASRNEFMRVVRNPNGIAMEEIFDGCRAEILFFGHDHSPSDVSGKARYINPGSLGCCSQALARYTIANFVDAQVDIQHYSVSYDDKELYEAFEDREVPERDFIYKVFFGGRFGA
jgi:predicted phosphodiesterase